MLAGADHLDEPLRWVHATELADIAPLLRAGDLVLTTGTGLPSDADPAGLAAFARSLADVDCAGLLVEYGRRWRDALPNPLVEACRDLALPLVALAHEIRFAELAQTVGELIVDHQLSELRDAQRVHEAFTELSFAQAGPADVLAAVQRLAGAPVVLESDQHRPLDFLAGAEDVGGFLDGWQSRSARVNVAGRTGWDERNGWLVTRLGPRERVWGRLIISSPTPPSQRLITVAERAAAALALHRLHERDRDNATRRRHHELMLALQATPDSPDVLQRCELAGFPTSRRQYVGLVVRPRRVGADRTDLDELVAAVVRSAHEAGTPALVSELDRDVRVLLSLPVSSMTEPLVHGLASRIARQHDVSVAVGRASSPERTLMEARQVADAVSAGSDRLVHRLEDVHLRGLLRLLADDDRLKLYTDRELEPLRRHEADHGSDLLAALRALVGHPSSKSDAARSLHLSRAAFYDRLSRVEQILGVDLDDPDVRVSLHVALLADELSAKSG